MLIPVRHLKRYWKIDPRGSLHVGAHLGEEQADYQKYGFEPTIWIEAQPELAEQLRLRVDAPSIVIQAVAWNTDGEDLSLKITNNGQSSSVFDLGSHKTHYPEITVKESRPLVSARLDSILPKELRPNFVNLDIQGAEFQALEGLGNLLHHIDFIYSEVNRAQLYTGIRQVTDIDQYLQGLGFVRVATSWTSADWGDALYLRREWALNKFRGILGLKVRVGAYWIWLRLEKYSLARLLTWSMSRLSRFSQSKVQ